MARRKTVNLCKAAAVLLAVQLLICVGFNEGVGDGGTPFDFLPRNSSSFSFINASNDDEQHHSTTVSRSTLSSETNGNDCNSSSYESSSKNNGSKNEISRDTEIDKKLSYGYSDLSTNGGNTSPRFSLLNGQKNKPKSSSTSFASTKGEDDKSTFSNTDMPFFCRIMKSCFEDGTWSTTSTTDTSTSFAAHVPPRNMLESNDGNNDGISGIFSESNIRNSLETGEKVFFSSPRYTPSPPISPPLRINGTKEKDEKSPYSPNNLKRLLQQLEESDYDSYVGWERFQNSRRPRRRRPVRNNIYKTSYQGVSNSAMPPESSPDFGPDKMTSATHAPGFIFGTFDSGSSEGSMEGYVPEWNQPVGSRQPGGLLQHSRGLTIMPPVNPLEVDYSSRLMRYTAKKKRDKRSLKSRGNTIRVLTVCFLGVLGSFLSVSPRRLSGAEYTSIMKRNLLLYGSTLVGPAFVSFLVIDSAKISLEKSLEAFTFAFTWGYVLTIVAELVVPAIHLPWVYHEYGYQMQPVNSFLIQLLTYCVVSPIIEEYMKVWVAKRTGSLPVQRPGMKISIFRHLYTTASLPYGRSDQSTGSRGIAIQEPTHVHIYLASIVLSSLGLKAADNARRVLMYTYAKHSRKFLFAFMRGFFPLHELCAGLTAMNLARKHILGENVTWWQVYLPAILLHSWANFRGTKPIYIWGSNKPWNELQLHAWSFKIDTTLFLIVNRSIASIVWVSILLKILAYIIKTYWKLHRQHNSCLRQQLMSQ